MKSRTRKEGLAAGIGTTSNMTFRRMLSRLLPSSLSCADTFIHHQNFAFSDIHSSSFNRSSFWGESISAAQRNSSFLVPLSVDPDFPELLISSLSLPANDTRTFFSPNYDLTRGFNRKEREERSGGEMV